MSNLLVGIYTITPLHCGTGQAVGAIDLPIARERHTDHPLIPATSIKGRLREIAFDMNKPKPGWGDKNEWDKIATAIFGPKTDQGDEGAGAAIFSDARLIAFPVRSLQAVFYWVTCPMVLERCVRDLAAAQINVNVDVPPGALRSKVLVSSPQNDRSGLLVLEDLAYRKEEIEWNSANGNAAHKWAKWMQALLPEDSIEPNKARLLDYLVIVPDNDFTDLVTRTTPVAARIQLTSKKTTGKVPVKDEQGEEKHESGNLWYEETLPPDCLFYAISCPQDARVGSDTKLKAREIREKVTKLNVSPIQLGGNETVGQGWCHWRWPQENTDGKDRNETQQTDAGAATG